MHRPRHPNSPWTRLPCTRGPENAAPDYRSQDAGRTVWGLTIDREWNLAEINELALSFIADDMTRDWLYQQIEEIKKYALKILELINK